MNKKFGVLGVETFNQFSYCDGASNRILLGEGSLYSRLSTHILETEITNSL